MVLLSVPAVIAAAPAAKRVTFDIAPATAIEAFKQFAAQTDIQLLYTVGAVNGVKTNSVKGEFTPREAIDRMLAGTPLTAQQTNNGAIAVRKTGDFEKIGAGAAPTTAGSRPDSDRASAVGQGIIVGTVSNQATSDLLPGATVQIEGRGVNTTTERGGEFSLTAPAGEYLVLVSFSGLESQYVPVTVRPGQKSVISVALTSSIYMLDPVTVMGIREGSALAIQAQRNSMNVKTVVAADMYGTPSANPGELVQRLPGVAVNIVGSEVQTVLLRGMAPGFAQITLDGDRIASSGGTSVGSDMQIQDLGTGNVERVELIKAPTPDMNANAIGGYVNLISKRAFDLPGRRISVTAGTLWRKRSFEGSPFRDRPDGLDLFTLAYSDVFSVLGRRNNLGIALNVNHRKSMTTQDESGPGGLVSISQAILNPVAANPLQRVVGPGDLGYDVLSRNAGLAIDYKVSDASTAFFKMVFNSNRWNRQYFRTSIGNTGATVASFAAGSTYDFATMLPAAASTAMTETSDFTRNSQGWTASGGFERKFPGDAVVEIRGTFSHANTNLPAWIRVQSRATGIGFEIDRRNRDPWYPKFTQTAGPSVYDANNYQFTSLIRQSNEAPNDLYGARVDFKKSFNTRIATYVKAGLKYDEDRREQRPSQSEATWVGADRLPNSADDVITPYVRVRYLQADGNYGPFPYTSIPGSGGTGDPLNAPVGSWAATAANAYNSYVSSKLNDVRLETNIASAYIMGNARLGKLKALAGVRAERTEVNATGWVRNTTASWGGNSVGGNSFDPAVVTSNAARAARSFVRRATGTGEYRNFFPGAHLVYEPLNGLLLRGSFNKSITRPPTTNQLPTVTENPDVNPPTITRGNPELGPYTSNNFELGVEKYFEPVGVVSASFFLKEISNYFRAFVSDVGPEGIDGQGTYAGYRQTQTQNTGRARIRGVELRYDQQLSFLPGILRGLGINSNFTYLETKGDYGTTEVTSKLLGFRPRSGSGGLSYRGFGIQVNLLATWSDWYLSQDPGGGLLVYAEPRTMVDLKLQYRVRRQYDVFLDIYNLTDEPTRTDVSEDGRIRFSRNDQGIGFITGVKARF